MPEIKHLNVVLPNYIEVHAAETVYRLRDDVETTIGLFVLRLQALEQELPTAETAATMSIAEQRRRLDTYRAEVLAVCTEIFRHSYPAISDEEVADALPHAARLELVRLFFTSLLQKLATSQPSAAASLPSAATEAPAETRPTTGKRRTAGK